jgi:hypothetical protein
MDLSRLDSGLAEPVTCIPGTWTLSKQNPVIKPVQLAEEDMTMAELIDKASPAHAKKISPHARFEIPKVTHITPEMKLELAAIRLRRYAYKDKFMKSSDSKDIPTRFHIGTEIGGGLQAVGGGKESQAAGTANRKRKSGKSHLMNLVHDETVRNWLHKNIEKRTNVARPKSKHKPIKPVKRH